MTFSMGPSLLFCPADRPDRFQKAAARADAVIIDLEDAVASSAKSVARDALVASRLDPATTIVRVNAAGSADFSEDMAALAKTSYRTVMVPKAAEPGDVVAVSHYDVDYRVVALCETAAGILGAERIAAEPCVMGLMLGPDDLIASLAGTSSRFDGGGLRPVASHARSVVLLAAGAAGKAAIDTVYLDIGDLDGLAAEATDAAASGFVATACIHPSQVAVIREAYLPGDEEFAYAKDILQAAGGEQGVFRFRGRMIDSPVLAQAERIMHRRDGL